ncbi:hypothetical protein CPZ30_19505 [Paenibacillus lautus]|nr:hypothetical protein CPZ30_19505 [Paenibacillus lautus]
MRGLTGYSRFQVLTSLLGPIYFLDMPIADKQNSSIKQGAARVGLAIRTRSKKKTGSQDPASSSARWAHMTKK